MIEYVKRVEDVVGVVVERLRGVFVMSWQFYLIYKPCIHTDQDGRFVYMGDELNLGQICISRVRYNLHRAGEDAAL